MGYFLARRRRPGISLQGDSPNAEEELRHAREDLFDHLIRPAFATALAGGDWPESWQYGDIVVLGLAIYADAERRITGGRDVFGALPWLHEVVRAARAHATLPDGVHAYDGGDWSDKPARMPATSLWALATLLPEGDPVRAESLGLARALHAEHHEEAWIAAVADDPEAPAIDPRRGRPASFSWGPGSPWRAANGPRKRSSSRSNPGRR